MHRLRTGVQRRSDQRIDVQVTLRCRGRPDGHRYIGHPHREAIAICLAVHREGLQAQLACGAYDPDRDLAAIGNQQPLE